MQSPNDTLDQAAIFAALDYYFPDGFEAFDPADPSPTTYAEYLAWCQSEPLTLDQIVSGARETIARQARKAEIRTERERLRALWISLPGFILGSYNDSFESANRLLDARDYDAAVDLIRFESPKPGYDASERATFEQVRGDLVTALEHLRTLALS